MIPKMKEGKPFKKHEWLSVEKYKKRLASSLSSQCVYTYFVTSNSP